jgi:hypothetical protein
VPSSCGHQLTWSSAKRGVSDEAFGDSVQLVYCNVLKTELQS